MRDSPMFLVGMMVLGIVIMLIGVAILYNLYSSVSNEADEIFDCRDSCMEEGYKYYRISNNYDCYCETHEGRIVKVGGEI